MRDQLLQGAAMLGVTLTDADVNAFECYYRLLEEKNRVMNLTAITEENEVTGLHFLDSLALLKLVDFRGKAVIDIGSGAGFPGLPLKIAERGLFLTLLDAQRKRVDFLEELCSALKLGDVTCIHARAEEAGRLPIQRDGFDIAVSRAVARLNVLSELCLPFVKPGGTFIAMKGTDSETEIQESAHALKELGASLEGVSDYKIPGSDVTHRAVVIRKISPTPDLYPRRFAKIEKKPL